MVDRVVRPSRSKISPKYEAPQWRNASPAHEHIMKETTLWYILQIQIKASELSTLIHPAYHLCENICISFELSPYAVHTRSSMYYVGRGAYLVYTHTNPLPQIKGRKKRKEKEKENNKKHK
jgi:hypothetical protein